MSPALTTLIEALAEKLVDDYLRTQAAADQAASAERTERVELPPVNTAA